MPDAPATPISPHSWLDGWRAALGRGDGERPAANIPRYRRRAGATIRGGRIFGDRPARAIFLIVRCSGARLPLHHPPSP